MLSYCTLDLETTYDDYYKRVGSPFNPTNEVVMTGYTTTDDAKIDYEYEGKVYDGKVVNFSKDIPESIFNYKYIIAHNSKFELLWMLTQHYKRTIEWLQSGGVLWCTQYVHYRLSGNTAKMSNLDSLALKHGGFKKYDKIKDYWEAGIQTNEIPKAELELYLRGDVINTWLIFRNQYKKVKEKGLLPSLQGLLSYMCFTGLCEFNGMYVNKPKLEQLRAESLVNKELEIKTMRKLVSPLFKPEHLDLVDFNKNAHVSAIIYGGIIKHETQEHHTKDGVLQYYGPTAQKAGEPVYRKRIDEIQVKGIGLQITDETKTKKEGVGQTNTKKLEWHSDYPFIKTLLQHRKTCQLLKTFLNPDGGGVLGLLHPDGFLHGQLLHALTATARLSSSKPNMQNLEKKSDLRKAFTSRFLEGHIVELDWSGLENSTTAQITQDKALLDDLWAGVDLHCKRAALINGYSYEEFYKKYREGLIEFDKMRALAKSPSFAYAYGAGIAKLIEATKLSRERILEFININRQLYPNTVTFYEDLFEELMGLVKITPFQTIEGNYKKTTVYHNLFGWPVRFYSNDAPLWKLRKDCEYGLGKEHPYTKLVNKLKDNERSKLYPVPQDVIKRGLQMTGFTSTVFKNYPNQNLAAEIVALFSHHLLQELWKYILNGNILPINTIHDSYVFDVRDTEHLNILKDIVQEKQNTFVEHLKLCYNVSINAPLKLDIKSGFSWKL